MAYGRRRTDPHEKSMGSYELFAWRDAMAMASMLEENFDVKAVRTVFEDSTDESKRDFERRNSDMIQELIGLTESRRMPYLRKVCKDVSQTTMGIMVVLGIIALVRVRGLLELRDRCRMALAPGGMNRGTCSGLYGFYQGALELDGYAWPDEVFDAYGGDGGWDEDDEGEDD